MDLGSQIAKKLTHTKQNQQTEIPGIHSKTHQQSGIAVRPFLPMCSWLEVGDGVLPVDYYLVSQLERS